MKKYISLLLHFVLLFNRLQANEEECELKLTKDILFVSLGSTCEPAHMLRYCELRKAAFPFDWIVSQDGEALIEMLDNDFQDFLHPKHFVLFGPVGHLLHTRYHLEFLHEGDFRFQFWKKMDVLKTKYQRRIDRFRSLNTYPGKVVFIRYGYPYTMTDPHRCYRYPENLQISEAYASRLYDALKSFFPDLDFHLLILNSHEKTYFEEQTHHLNEHISISKFPIIGDVQLKTLKYKEFFEFLVKKLTQI